MIEIMYENPITTIIFMVVIGSFIYNICALFVKHIENDGT